MNVRKKHVVLASPFLIILVSFGNAHLFGQIIGKWAFIPIILIQWCLWLFFTFKYAGKEQIVQWLRKSKGAFAWNILALFTGLIPLPLFLMHYETLAVWQVWVPWILLALINPWIEEFYWRGLLLEYTQNWSKWIAVVFTSLMFAISHSVFGVNSELNKGITVMVSTLIMGLIWAWVYKKTFSLRWVIFAHFLVDIFNLSSASFLDLYSQSAW